jgi:hypothetical protein
MEGRNYFPEKGTISRLSKHSHQSLALNIVIVKEIDSWYD